MFDVGKSGKSAGLCFSSRKFRGESDEMSDTKPDIRILCRFDRFYVV